MIMQCAESQKVVFSSKGKAGAALRSLQLKADYTGQIYPCPFCNGYHIGREKKNAHKNKYKAQSTRD